MPEWLNQAVAAGDAFPAFHIIVIRVTLAIFLGMVVAVIYRLTLGRRSDTGTLPTTLVLLAVLIAVVALVIGDNVARAFGLVGALSIVRFRTVVEDTRDTAFVIFAVAVGMAAGAGYALLAAVAVPSVGLAAAIMCWWDNRQKDLVTGTPARLTIRIGMSQDPDELFRTAFEKHTLTHRLYATSTVRQGSALELVYTILLKSPGNPFHLVSELNRIEGIESVEVKCD